MNTAALSCWISVYADKEGIQGTTPGIREQAKEYDQGIQVEYARILIHGVLHLAGYEDQSAEEKNRMRNGTSRS